MHDGLILEGGGVFICADGSRAGMTTPAGSFSYAYDGDQRPTSVTNPFSETASWSYYQNNWLKTQTLGNGAYSTSTYDPRGFLTSLVNSASGGGELSNFSGLIHDSLGNLGSISAVVDSEPATYSGSTTYTYDNADELKQEASHRNGTYTNNFSYDTAQNPTTSRSVSGKTYNSDNQRSDTGFTFDGSGNPTTYGGATLAFDGENRLSKYGTSTMSATYDATSLRASKTNSAGTTYYLYDGTMPVCELSSTGAVNATNTFGALSLLSRHAGSTSTFYTFDAQGNVSERLSSTGTVQTASTFDAFGLSTTTGTVSDPFGYCAKYGYYTDTETGLQLATFRYYDPSAGRFVTRDPIGYSGGIDLYAYLQNNASNFIDASGFDISSVAANWIACGVVIASAGIIGFGSGQGFWPTVCSAFFSCLAAAASTAIGGALIETAPVFAGCAAGALGGLINWIGNAACGLLCHCNKPSCDLKALGWSIATGCFGGLVAKFAGATQIIGNVLGFASDELGVFGYEIC